MWSNKWNIKSPNQSFWSNYYSWKTNEHFWKWKTYVSQLVSFFAKYSLPEDQYCLSCQCPHVLSQFQRFREGKWQPSEESCFDKKHGWGGRKEVLDLAPLWILARRQMDQGQTRKKNGCAPNVLLRTLKSPF